MLLDIPTLFIVASCIAGLLGFFLFFAWIQDRSIRALAWWGAGYMLGGLGLALWIAEAALAWQPPFEGLPNALLFAACGTIWNGARLFYARNVRPFALAAGAIVWTVACQFPSFAHADVDRVVLSSLIVSIYSFATAREIRADRRKRTRAHGVAICIPILHGIVFLPPIPLAVMRAAEGNLLSSGWLAVFGLETLLYSVGTAFIVLMMAKKRTETFYKTVAMTDPLTGLLNRRGFMERAEALIARNASDGNRVSLLMFDLDYFKSINDRYGHAAGDDALRVFSETIRYTMREGDVVGRLGGEEFAAIVSGSPADVTVAAERVRACFEAAGTVIAGHEMNATVSIGAAGAIAKGCNIERLLSRADAALYASKQAGRNRVTCASDDVGAAPKAARPVGCIPAPAGIACAA